MLIEDISGAALHDPLTLAVADKIVPEYDARFSIENKIGPAMVEITLNDGQCYVKQVAVAYGHPQNPISEAEFKTKFFDCAATSVKPPSAANAAAAFELGSRLAEALDIRELIRLLG